MKTSILSIIKHVGSAAPIPWAIQCEEYLFGVLRTIHRQPLILEIKRFPPLPSATRRDGATRDRIFLASTLLSPANKNRVLCAHQITTAVTVYICRSSRPQSTIAAAGINGMALLTVSTESSLKAGSDVRHIFRGAEFTVPVQLDRFWRRFQL